VLVVLALAAYLWPASPAPVGVNLGRLPWWGGARDVLLEGPDAGEWARNMSLLFHGQLDQLDHHRLPSWMLMVSAMMTLVSDVVIAGHLVNRLLYLVLGLSVYGLGRLRGGRVVGILGAVIALTLPHAMSATQRFGVDMAITAMIPLVLLVAVAATRLWWLGLVSGLLTGLAAGLHYTTPPYLLPPLLVLILSGRGVLRRIGAVLLYLLGAAVSVSLLLRVYPLPTWRLFLGDVANGINPGAPNQFQATLDGAMAGLASQLPRYASAATAAAVDAVRISGLPWGVMLALPWLGVLGLGLGVARAGRGSWWRALLGRTDLAVGLMLLVSLAPLPVLAGVGAPERYGDNLLGVVAVLVARGIGSAVAVVDALVRAAWSRWPRGPLALGLGVPVVLAVISAPTVRRTLPPPKAQEIGTVLLARALARRFPAGAGVASPVRESLVLAGLSFCPQRVCPTQATVDYYQRCVRMLAQECAGDGPIGYVTTSALSFYDPNAKRLEMDAWVASQWEPADVVSYLDFTATIYEIPRPDVGADEDPLRGLPVPGQAPDGSVPPPP